VLAVLVEPEALALPDNPAAAAGPVTGSPRVREAREEMAGRVVRVVVA
jgi:hypothetical protein